MKYIKYFLLILSLFAVLACGDGSYSADGSAWACYSPKSDIYNADLYNAETNTDNDGAYRVAADTSYTVKFEDNGTEIVDFRVTKEDGGIITLPDIRTRHCFLGRENKVLLGWKDKNTADNYTTAALYKVTGDVTFTSVWEDGAEIYNAAELDGIRNNPAGIYKLMGNIDLAAYKGGAGWIPIGDPEDVNNFFTGKLYGNSYLIDSLTIDSDTASVAGLFGAIGGNAEIYDLKINLADSGISLTKQDVNKAAGALVGLIQYGNDSNIIIKNIKTSGGLIKADNCSASGDKYIYAGGLVGRVAASSFPLSNSAQITLDNLSNSIPVSVELSYACPVGIGGIIGRTDLTDAIASLTSAENDGAINLTDASGVGLSIHAGGFIGRGDNITIKAGANRGAVAVSSILNAYSGGIAGYIEGNSSIDSCYNDSPDNITAKSTDNTAFSYSGGIVGFMTGGGSVKNSHNYDNVTANSYNLSYAGGIVGWIESGCMIENDNNIGNVEAVSTANSAYSGGIAGRIAGMTGVSPVVCSVDNSSNNGFISAEGSYNAYSGGIAGWMANPYTLVENSHNSVGTVSAIGTTACSGGITGYLNGGTITSSYNTGDVTIPASSLSYAGGIAGNIAVYTGVGGTIGGTIENNNNSGKVTAASTAASANLDAHSGGIAGYVGSSGVIRHSSNSGDVSSTSNGTFSLSHAGGIAGRILGTIENDNNTGKVTAKSDNTNAYSGGIVGYVSGGGSVKNAHNYDNVSATVTSSGNAYAGGIAGYMTGGGSVANSHNTDNISATASVDGQSFAGGIAGLVSGALAEIKTSYNNGEIYAVSSSLSASGGIVGKTENGGGTSLISNCYNTNYIYASASKVGSGESFAGGIVGGLWNSKIEKSYNIGNIETSTSDWNPRGGGIVADAPSSFIEYCAAINQKIKSGSMGRIFVYPDRILPNNFAYEGMEAVDSSFNGGIYKDGENKSLTDLQTQSTYKDAVGFGGLGWEFGNDDDHPWKMPLPGSAYLYPILYWQE